VADDQIPTVRFDKLVRSIDTPDVTMGQAAKHFAFQLSGRILWMVIVAHSATDIAILMRLCLAPRPW
jgi:hypothetical protein